MPSASPYLDSVLGVQEGGTAGFSLMAALKTAGINANPLLVMGGSIGANVLGKHLARAADAPTERMNFRLGSQQLELNALEIEAKKRADAEERARKRKMKAAQGALSKVFGAYQQIKGGTP